jgi:hypothetical protein
VYDPVNNPVRMAQQLGLSHPGGGTNQPAAYAQTLWLYETSEDTHLQCEAAGYFTNGGSLRMAVGDLVIVSSSVANGGGVTLHVVTNIAAQTQTSAGVGGGGFWPPGAVTIGGASGAQNTVATGLSGAGTTQGTATALVDDINTFSTVASGSGAILPAMNPGDALTVFNGGANALKLYPPVGAQLNALGNNSPYSIATATPLTEVTCVSATQYLARQSA